MSFDFFSVAPVTRTSGKEIGADYWIRQPVVDENLTGKS